MSRIHVTKDNYSLYLKEARSWETDRVLQSEKSRRVAWRIAIGSAAVAFASILAVVMLTPLKSVEPFVIRVDSSTGIADIVSGLEDARENYSEAINKYFTQWYVRYREGYSKELAEAYYHNTGLMSVSGEQQRYHRFFNPKNPASPLNVYGDYARVFASVFLPPSISFSSATSESCRKSGMTPNTKDNRWLKPVLVGVLAIILTGLWVQLAGGILLMLSGGTFEDATPLTFLQYAYHHGTELQNRLTASACISLAILVLPAIPFLVRSKKRRLFGDARFANRQDIRKAGLLGENGLIVGRIGNRYLMFGGAQHAIVSAPTRSGKGVGIVIPNLLNWPESTVVLDVKHENWDITSGYRARHGQACYLFNPAARDGKTHRYNPLSYISDDPNFRIDDIQKIGNMLFPDRPGTDPIWTATPRSLFTGIVLYLMETPGKPLTFGQVLRETLAEGDGAAYFTKIISDRMAAGRPLSGDCTRSLNSYVSITSENTRSGIITGFRSQLELWMNPLVDAATSDNDFDLRDVRKKRMSIYVGVTPDNLVRMAPLLNLFFQQLIDLNTRELPQRNPELRHACLLLMDEFTAIGKIPILSSGIGYIAGYGLRMLPIIQSPSQLAEIYGRDAAKTFQTNHALQVVFPPKASETDTARNISEWLGYQTVKGISKSESGGAFKKTKSENTSEQRRALMLPQEITGLGQDKELVVLENVPPILAQKVVYYRDPVFTRRLEEVSPDPDKRAAFVPRIDLDAHIQSVSDMPNMTSRASLKGGPAPEAAKALAAFTLDFAPREEITDTEELKKHVDTLCHEAGVS